MVWEKVDSCVDFPHTLPAASYKKASGKLLNENYKQKTPLASQRLTRTILFGRNILYKNKLNTCLLVVYFWFWTSFLV